MSLESLNELQRAGLAIKTLRAQLRDVEDQAHEPIAIVGMACRFPGEASDPEAFWSLLEAGRDAVRDVPNGRWNKEELYDPRPGTPGKLYTLEAGWLEEVDRFDASFFGIAPKEAIHIDPQQRMLLEACWTAMENAGETVDRLTGAPIGVVLGVTSMDYAQQTIQAGRPELLNGFYTTGVTFNGGAGRVAYTFGFNGPTLAVDTACSSSLVALHLAIRSLRGRECRMALAAGVNVNLFPGNSISMCEARLLSPSGRCRTYDATADGMVRGEGLGVVLLKRLGDALADGNHIHAVIRGSAVNQDGASSSFTAPSGPAQEAVLRAALANARVKPSEVDYVEGHGSATPLGDPIEVRALSTVYGAGRDAEQPLFIGSVKTNIGHLESAAGMAGLFKLVLSLQHGRMVRQLHFSRPNPEIDWERCRVQVCAADREWVRAEGPRRGAVSAFGVSGTNAHVIVEQAPVPKASGPSRSHHALVLSAPTATGLDALTQRLTEHLKSHPEQPFADVAYTLQTGRAAFPLRRVTVCAGREEAIERLSSLDPGRVVTRQVARGRQRPVVFLFPGTGEHYPGMGRGLYDEEPVFRKEIDACAELLAGDLPSGLVTLLYGGDARAAQTSAETDFAAMVSGGGDGEGPLSRTLLGHASVFAVEYALARLLLSWGLRPQLMIGYSTGEYVAACVAGVMSLAGALKAVVQRAKLMEREPAGAMLSVMAGADELGASLGDGVWLAAANGPQLSVLAGHEERIAACAQRLQEAGIASRRVGVRQAFHTPLLSGIEAPFVELMSGLELKSPEIPIISNVTGARLTDAEARDPRYWYRHAVGTVRFAEGIAAIWNRPERVLVEVGPGQALCSFALQQGAADDGRLAVSTLPARYERHSDVAFLQSSLGKLWFNGVAVDWRSLYAGQDRAKVPLPTYPFERQRYWIESQPQGTAPVCAAPPAESGKQPIESWYSVPEWRRRTLAPAASRASAANAIRGHWLLVGDGGGIGGHLRAVLQEANQRVVHVEAGPAFAVQGDDRIVIDPTQPEHYSLLTHHLSSHGVVVRNVVHLASAGPLAGAPDAARSAQVVEEGFLSLLWLIQALGETPLEEGISLAAVTAGAQCVLGDDISVPERAVVEGLMRSAPQEIKGLRCCTIDLPEEDASLSGARWARWIVEEFAAGVPEPTVAYRGAARWAREFAPVTLEAGSPETLPLRRGGVYVVTGGIGGLGREVARFLAERWSARLVLVGRTAPPPEETWEAVVGRGESDPDYEKVRLLRALAVAGAETLVAAADVTDRAAMDGVLATARARFGAVNGIFHCAGVPGAGLILTKRREACEAVFASKVAGALHLAELCATDDLDAVVYFSSVLALHGGIGQADYAGANAFLDAFAQWQRSRGTPAVAVDWGMWRFDSWQEKLTANLPGVQEYLRERRMRLGITLEEGMDALGRVMRLGAPQVAVSPIPLDEVIREHERLELDAVQQQFGETKYERPARLLSEYLAPQTETQSVLAQIWSQAFGIEPIGIVDNFFELGGHSLLGTRVMADVRGRFGVTVPLRALFTAPTIEAMALVIEEQILADIEAMPDGRDAETGPPDLVAVRAADAGVPAGSMGEAQ